LIPNPHIRKIQILAKPNKSALYTYQYRLIWEGDPSVRQATVPLEPLADMTLLVRGVNEKQQFSVGQFVRIVVKSKNIIRENVDGRDMFVYLPPGYDARKSKKYPVVYLLDGQNLFSKYVGGSREWQVDETLDWLISTNKVEPMIAVGIFNSSDRKLEYIPYKVSLKNNFIDGRGAVHAKWIVEKVIPFIEQKYHASARREDRAIFGNSLGGVESLWMVLNYSNIFSMGAAISAATVPGVIENAAASKAKDIKVWMDAGEDEIGDSSYGDEVTYAEQARLVTDLLLGKGFKYGKDIVYYEVPNVGSHTEDIVAHRIEYPFIFFKGKSVPGVAEHIELYAERISRPKVIPHPVVNAVADFNNGLRYSLYSNVAYRTIGKTAAQIDSTGVITNTGTADITVAVQYQNIEKQISFNPATAAPKSSEGRIIEFHHFPSQYVEQRNIEVLLPPGYTEGCKYKVLYMHDGQNIFNPKSSFGQAEWGVDEVLDSLYKANAIDSVIVVGVWNTNKRYQEYMPAKPQEKVKQALLRQVDQRRFGGIKELTSDDYLKFLVEEVKPFIDRRFSTKSEKENTFIMGSSMGGLISLYAISEYPDVFGGAASLSTHWIALDGVFLDYVKSSLPDPLTHKLYFDFGTVGLDSSYAPYQSIADEYIQRAGYQKNKNWVSLKITGAAHTESDWRNRLHKPLLFLLQKNKKAH
jgi:predicted alpha/beta superfamily hydrolase